MGEVGKCRGEGVEPHVSHLMFTDDSLFFVFTDDSLFFAQTSMEKVEV